MSTVETVIVKQTNLFSRIQNAISNYEKKYKSKMSIGSLTSRIDALKNNWKEYQANDDNINAIKKDEHNSQEYKNDIHRIDSVEEFYIHEHGKFLEIKDQLAPPLSLSATDPQCSYININELPRIEVPYFS